MLFDWFTMGAQVLNFVVLVWLMKHFLYQPILRAIAAREKLVADQLANATAAKTEAQKEKNLFSKKNQDYDAQSATLLTQAQTSAKVEAQKLLEAAKKSASDWSSKQHVAFLNEEKNLHEAVSQRAQTEIFSIARKTLADLAGVDVERRMVDVFIQRLREVSGKESKGPTIVRSAFNLLSDQRAKIEEAIKSIFTDDAAVKFEISPGLICGIVLFRNETKIAWSIDDYLISMQGAVKDLLHQRNAKETSNGP